MIRWIAVAISIILNITVSYITHANPDDGERAKEAFKEAVFLYEKGDFPGAADKFRTCYALKKSYKILFNIGQAEAAAKRYGLSLQTFEKYLADGGDDIDMERQDAVREEIRRLRDMTGFIQVTAPDAVEIFVDGTSRGTYPAIRRIPVSIAVVHEIKIVNADGKEGVVKRASVTGGDSVSVAFDDTSFSADSIAAQPPPIEPVIAEKEPNLKPEVVTVKDPITIERTSDSPWKNRLFLSGVIAGGVGIALMAGGFVTGVITLKKDTDVQDKCKDGVCDTDYRDLVEKRDHLATASTVLWIAGGAATATGIALMLVWKNRKETLQSSSLSILPGIGGFTVTGAF